MSSVSKSKSYVFGILEVQMEENTCTYSREEMRWEDTVLSHMFLFYKPLPLKQTSKASHNDLKKGVCIYWLFYICTYILQHIMLYSVYYAIYCRWCEVSSYLFGTFYLQTAWGIYIWIYLFFPHTPRHSGMDLDCIFLNYPRGKHLFDHSLGDFSLL